jgi:hypothetical protein
MRIDPRDLRRHYDSLPDGELLALNRDDLTPAAQAVYDEAMADRGLLDGPATEAVEEPEEGEEVSGEFEEFEDFTEEDEGPEPEWMEDAATACAFVIHPGSSEAEKASHARSVLRAAGIPSRVSVTPEESEQSRPRDVVSVMVPGALALHATSILDRDMFNEEHDMEWRTHMEALSDDDIVRLDPRIFCAGLLDRVARMKRAYAEEIAARKLKAQPE